MAAISYVNGRYVPHARALVHVEDRGYQFADGVYELIAVHGGALVDGEAHLERLGRSLDALRMGWPMERRALRVVLAEVLRRNRVRDGKLYVQITRGVAPRNHAFPARASGSLVVTVRAHPRFDRQAAGRGVTVVTMPDRRWKRCDIKSVSLLPNVLDKQTAVEAGAFEAWLVDGDGRVTEGTASNAWIVTKAGTVVTRHLSSAILPGITRAVVLETARRLGLVVEERPFTVEEAKVAREAFLTSTTSFVKPVVGVDGVMIGDGGVGPLTAALLDRYAEHLDAVA